MDSPYLERGESIILTTDRVSINSSQYDVLLTTRYLILIDVRYARFQPQKIPLLAILSVKGGKTAPGDLVITLYFSDTSLTGSGQMNLIFSRYPGEQRDRERDEWLKKLMERIVAVRQETIGPKTIIPEQGIGIRPVTRHTIAPEMQPPHTTVIDIRPEPVELGIIHDEPESPATPEEPAELVSVTDATHPDVTPTGEEPADTELQSQPESSEPPASPEEPAEPIRSEDITHPDVIPHEEEPADSEPQTLPESSEPPTLQDEPVEPIRSEDVSHPDVIPHEEEPADTELQSQPESSEPPTLQDEPVESIRSEDVTHPDVIPHEEEQDKIFTDTELQSQPESSELPASPEEPVEPISIEDVSHPDVIPHEEELADTELQSRPESSMPPTLQDEPVEPISIPDVTLPKVTPPEEDREKTSSTYLSGPPGSAIVELTTERGNEAGTSETIPGERSEPVEPGTQPAADIPSDTPGSPPPPVVFRGLHKTVIIAIIILILGIAGAMVLYPEYLASPEKGIFPVQNPTIPETTLPVPSTQLTSAPTQVVIPPTGVWVRVTYTRNYYGRVGNPGSLRGITGSGDRFYQMDEENRLVQVQVYKTDNTGETLTVEIYRNGEMIHRRSTTSPMGVIELLIDAETGNPPGIITPGVTQTPVHTAPIGNNQTGAVSDQTVLNPGNEPINQSLSDTGNGTVSGSRALYF